MTANGQPKKGKQAETKGKAPKRSDLRPMQLGILGFALRSPVKTFELFDLRENHFPNIECRRLFRVVRAIYEELGPDGVQNHVIMQERLLAEGMRDDAIIDVVSGAVAVAAGSMTELQELKSRLINECTRTSLKDAATLIAEIAECEHSTDELCEMASQAVSGAVSQAHAVQVRSLADTIQEEIERVESGNEVQRGHSTGLTAIDNMTNGLHDGEMVVIGARPSVGKSAMLGHWAYALGVEQSLPGLVISLEMPDRSYVQRMISTRAQVDLQDVRRGCMGNSQRQRYISEAKRMLNSKIFIEWGGGMTIRRIAASARRCFYEHGIRWMAVDYLQLVDPTRLAGESTNDAIGRISTAMKSIAASLNIPVIALSQLNRDPEKREGNRPILADLRSSGSIENDADVVILLWRESMAGSKRKNAEGGEGSAPVHEEPMECIIAKQRNGPVGTVKVLFRNRCAGISDYYEESSGGWSPPPPSKLPYADEADSESIRW